MTYEAESRSLRLAVAGDVMLSRPLRPYRESAYLGLRDVLTAADACFANFESAALRYEDAVPGVTQGTYMMTEPRLLDDLTWYGVNLVSCANNHAMDFGEQGVLASITSLDEAGLVHAGSGRNLRDAQAPAYLETPAGRVALVAADASWREWHRAHDQRPDSPGKPGVNSLRFERIYDVDRATFDQLRAIGAALGLDSKRERDKGWFFSDREVGVSDETSYSFLGQTFRAGDRFAVHANANAVDLADNVRQVREARRQADWVVVSLHFHEFGGASLLSAASRAELTDPADFVVEFAHAVIDAGADVFVGHGPHRLLGAEIYKERPIFYSLGNLILQSDTTPFVPSHAYERFGLGPDATPADFHDRRTRNETQGPPASSTNWQSIVPVCVFRDGALAAIELHPVDLGFGRPRSQRGRPLLADRDLAATIIDRFERLCAGASISIDRSGETCQMRWSAGPNL
jgi:poly-gamma-glutamate capsule biosynthesis protein CapA/YwtB (metallophosphatase superfamily)